MIKIQDKIRVRRMMSREMQNFHIMVKQGMTWYNSINSGTFLILDMVCLLQPECNFLYGSFRCKLPVEVVDMEVKVTSMQGMHIFKRDRTTQLIRCMPWTTKLCLHPNIVKKMKTFLRSGKQDGTNNPSTSQLV